MSRHRKKGKGCWARGWLGMGIALALLAVMVLPAAASDVQGGQEPVQQAGQAQGSGGQDPGQAEGAGAKDPNQPSGSGAKDPNQPSGSDAKDPDGSEDGMGSTALVIDNQNIYEGMDRPYSEGYIPRVENGRVLVVVPMLLEEEGETALKNNVLRVSLDLGETAGSPFVYRNYEKNITQKPHSVNNGTGTSEAFVASFQLELSPERYNGSYPITLAVSGTDTQGNAVSQSFVVYVTITDGKDPNAEPEPEPEPEPPTFAPKLLVQSYRYSKEEILAGDTVTAEITLQNTSKSQMIKNLTITVSAPAENLTLQSPTDSVYIDSVKAGETCGVAFEYQVNPAAPQGQYDLTLAMDYADAKGNTYTGTGKARLSVKQPTELQFDPIVLPAELEVGDVAQLQVQAMNLGRCKAYHVRAELAADGLTPQGTIFIGDIEAGAAAMGSTQISVGGLTEGDSMYGETKGTVTFYYEDEGGKEYTQQLEFRTSIASPFSDEPVQEAADEPGQWWILMAVILVLLCCCGAFLAVRRIRERKDRENQQGEDRG